MRDVEVRRHVAAPVERVWALATDLEGSPRVVRGIEAVEVLTPGPFGVGTRWRETRRMFGRSAAVANCGSTNNTATSANAEDVSERMRRPS